MSQTGGDREAYTPQVMVNGAVHVLGSDRAGIEDAAMAARRGNSEVMSLPVSIKQADKQLNVSVSAGNGRVIREIWICAISKSVPIRIGRGENRGREVTLQRRVRNWLKVGDWTGRPELDRSAGERQERWCRCRVVYVQDGSREKPGPMLGAAYTTLEPDAAAVARR